MIGACFTWVERNCCCTNHPDLAHLRTEANAGLLLAEEPNLHRHIIRVSDRKKNTVSKSSPIKQANSRNAARSFIERRVEPLRNLNKGHTERTLRGLPFDASYARTSMHELVSPLFLNHSITINAYPALVTIIDSTRGWPPLGLLTLPTAGEREQVTG